MAKIPITVDDYRQKQSSYEDLSSKVEDILFEICEIEKINFVFVESRVKSIVSFQSKIKQLVSEKKELYDLAGIRIAGYVRSDVKKILKVIKDNFDIDELKSKDKASELNADQFGYRAIHLVGKLPNTRIGLPEYKKFKGMYFEIQIKTILEHGWAQINHDRNYKYNILPKHIQHEFYLVAGILETADSQFEIINEKIESFTNSIKQKRNEGKLEELEITPATFRRYIIDKFENELEINPVYGHDKSGDKEIKEILFLKITNLKELDSLIPKNFSKICKIFIKKIGLESEMNLSLVSILILYLVLEEKSEEILKETREGFTIGIEDDIKILKESQKSVSK